MSAFVRPPIKEQRVRIARASANIHQAGLLRLLLCHSAGAGGLGSISVRPGCGAKTGCWTKLGERVTFASTRYSCNPGWREPLAGAAPGIVVVLTAETPHTRHPHSTRPSVTVHVQMHHDSTLRCVHPTVDCRMLSSARKRIRQGSPGFFDLIRLRRVRDPL